MSCPLPHELGLGGLRYRAERTQGDGVQLLGCSSSAILRTSYPPLLLNTADSVAFGGREERSFSRQGQKSSRLTQCQQRGTKLVPLLTSATLERLGREAWSQLTFTQLYLCTLLKCAGVGWLFFTPPLLDEFKPTLKLFKSLILFVMCVCVCVHWRREGGGSVLPTIPSSFHFCFLPSPPRRGAIY